MNGSKFLFLYLVFWLFSQDILAQPDSAFAKSGGNKALRKMGVNALKQKDPATAAFYLEAAVKRSPSDYDARFLLASAYLELRDYERAQRMFLNAYKANTKKRPEALYYHALMQKSNGLYDSAAINFRTFKKIYKGKNKSLRKQAAKEVAYCDSVKKIILNKNKVSLTRLDTSINKVNTEAAPLVLNDNEMLFVSFRTEKREYEEEGDVSKAKTRKLYKAKRYSGKWIFAGEFEGPFNDDQEHLGNACLSPDGKRLYFTRCKANFKGEMICAIYRSELQGENWSEPEKLQKEINNPKYTSTMPSVATDPVKGNDILFFVSNRKKGKGKLDIWYSVYDKKRKVFKIPRNAGSKINTQENEISPFFDNDTRALYFSSDGMGGLGGYDIFRSKGNGNKWELPENIGTPYNSGADDLYYTLSPNRKEGYFVSNRKGGNTLKNKTCCDDIYQFKKNDYVQVKLEGNIHEATNIHDEIKDAFIEIYIKDKGSDEKFLVKTVKTDAQGNYSVALEPGNDYHVLVKKDAYLGNSQAISTRSLSSNNTIRKDLQLVKRPSSAVKMPNVTYQTDKWELMPASKVYLDSTVYRLMIDNPEVIVEIQAHTDNHGSDAYNQKLSQKRAEAVVKYLIGKGIDPARLQAKGYGESMPVAPNEHANGNDNPEGRAMNRRTDFKIIGVIDAELINSAEIK